MLSVAAVHQMVAPVANVPALVGPAVPSPVAGVGSTGATAGATQQVQVVLEIIPVTINVGGGSGVTQGFFIVSESFSTGPVSGEISTPTSAAASANPSTSSGASASTAAASPSITPLTATILAGPTGANRAPIIVVVQPQVVVANLAPSTIGVTTQAILATATLEEQPLQPPVLGQGFESPVGQSLEYPPGAILKAKETPTRIEMELFPGDYIEPMRATPEDANPAAPAQPAETPAVETTGRVIEPVDAVLAAPVTVSEWGKHPDLPLLTPRIEIQTHDEYATWSLATVVGTTALATGGYQLLMGGSARFNQRWLPTRRSSRRKSKVQ